MDLLAFDGVPGSAYLLIYLGVCAALLILSRWLSWWLRMPGGDGVELSLERQEVAFLAGGPQRTLAAAFAGLLEAETIALEPTSPLKLWPSARVRGSLPPGATPLERALVAHGTGVPLDRSVIAELGRLPEIDAVRESLEDARLVLASDAAREARVWLALVGGAAVAFAIPRLVLAYERNRPAGLLVAMMLVVTLIVVTGLFSRAIVRSRRGDAVLARYERRIESAGASASLADQVVFQGAAAYPPLMGIFPVPANDGGGGDGGCGGGGCGGCGGCGG